ncbi:MAG: hypothetical protein GXO07_07085 [Crenarchaeota archaeon]|nr:hypothetical protein [Thermoproteota archaeon]
MDECFKEFEECFESCVEESRAEPGPSCGSLCWKLYWECERHALSAEGRRRHRRSPP